MPLARWLRKPQFRGIWAGLLCAVVSWLITREPLVQGLEDWTHDGFFWLRGTRTTSARTRVILIGLDDDSLHDLKRPLSTISPELAEVVTFLKERQVAAIGLDLLVPESLANEPDLKPGKRGDATKLGAAINNAGNVVLAEWKIQDKWFRPVPQWRLKSFLDPGESDFGFVNATEDDDYFLRRQQLLIRDGEEAHQHFALALFAVAHHAKVEWTDDGLRVGGDPVPLDEEQKLRVNYVGPPGTFKLHPFKDVLAAARKQKSLSQDWAGAIVIIGVTARSQQDYHATPYSNNALRLVAGASSGLIAGSEVHAHIVATLEDRAYLRQPHWSISFTFLLVMGGLLGAVFARLNLAWGFAVAFVNHWLWKAICFAAFTYANWRLEVNSMLLLGALTYGVTFLFRWRMMRRMLGLVKSEAIARLLESDPEHLYLSGEERVVTVLFADIRDFSTYSESHPAREVVKLLNTYFTAIVPIVEKHGGTLNQYMGDGMMVIFGAPDSYPDHALRAVRAALEMVRRIHELKDTWAELDKPGLRMGVGINTGRAVAGTVGSPRRLDYSAIGNTVNTAARIEAKNKELGTEILISSETYHDLPTKDRRGLGCDEQGQAIQVKGIAQAVIVHAVRVEQASAGNVRT